MTADDALWYDGEVRARPEALGRIARDARSFLERAVRELERDDAAWLLLLDELHIPPGLDDPGEATISGAYAIEVTEDRVVVGLSALLPRQLEATLAALRKAPWCVAPRLHGGVIEMQVQSLDPAILARMEKKIAAHVRAIRAHLERGSAAFVAMAAPSPLAEATAGLADALLRVEAIRVAKVERLRRAGARS